MKLIIENCYYELLKELLMSQDSLIEDIHKDGYSIVVTLKQGCTKDDFLHFLNLEPMRQFCQNARISTL